MGGQPVRAHELFDPLVDSPLIHQPDVRSADDRAHRVGFDTKAERLGAPSFGHRRSGDPVVLRLAGIQGGDLRGPGRRCTALGERGFDLDPPRRKRSQHWFGDAVDVGDAVHDWTPRHPEALGHLGPQVRLVQVAGGLGVEVEVAAVEGRPAAVRPLRHVRDQHVGVEMWVAGAARSVSERRADEPVARNLVDAVGPAPRPTRGSFQIAERLIDRGVVRTGGPARRLRSRPRPNRTDTDFGARNVRSNPGT